MQREPIDRMIESVAYTVRDRRVLDAMRRVPRERFVPESLRPWAYEDTALPIGEGQTISQPTVVAMMTEALQLTGAERVLEVGTGSGYQAAVLARLAREVVTVEVIEVLADRATRTLAELGFDNVQVVLVGDELGEPRLAPYDAIIVTAAAPQLPPALVEQLKVGGRIVIPVGSQFAQTLEVFRRTEQGCEREEPRGLCQFVPLLGPEGFAPAPVHRPLRRSALDELRDGLRSDDRDTLAHAAQELSEAHVELPESDLRRLREAASGEHDLARRAALRHASIVLLGPTAGPDALAEAMRSDNFADREAALDAAIEFGEGALRAIESLTRDEDRDVRWFAYEAARHIGGEAAIPLLIHGLRDEDFAIRWVAGSGLIEVGRDARQPLLHALIVEPPSLQFHRAARRVLRRIDGDGGPAHDALVESLGRGTTVVESGPLAFELAQQLGELNVPREEL
jgi:protein-L-isoaspartate(D-aspartate) O-methyltransferase